MTFSDAEWARRHPARYCTMPFLSPSVVPLTAARVQAALPASPRDRLRRKLDPAVTRQCCLTRLLAGCGAACGSPAGPDRTGACQPRRYGGNLLSHRSEEHTSELQSPCNLV